MTFTEEVIEQLRRHPEGLFGSDFVELLPNRWFVRSRIYEVLEKLVNKGIVREEFNHTTMRTKHFLKGSR